MLKENQEAFSLCNIDIWHKDNQGEGATVVIWDSGSHKNHFSYLKDIMEVPIPYRDNGEGHGVAVTAVGHQVAPKAKIIYMDFNSANRETRQQMIDWVIEHQDKIDTMNISLSFNSIIAKRYFPQLEDVNFPIVCATGNESKEDGITYPAKYPFTIAVGAYTSAWDGQTSYSNAGKEIDCIAPLDVYYPNSVGKIVRQPSGTSFASPVVAFSLVLYASWRRRNGLPKLTNDMARKFIRENARDLYDEGHDYKSGYGLFRLPDKIPKIDKGAGSVDKFSDIKSHWAKHDIELVVSKGLMSGFPDGTFKPDKPLTRAEFATIKARELNNKS